MLSIKKFILKFRVNKGEEGMEWGFRLIWPSFQYWLNFIKYLNFGSEFFINFTGRTNLIEIIKEVGMH